MRKLVISKQQTNKEDIAISKYFSDLSRTKVLSPKDEVELFEKVKAGDIKAREAFVRSNLRFVISVAKQYQHQGLPLSDLISEGNIGLLKALNRFDTSRGFKFISYAVWWIRQSILQALAEKTNLVRVPSNKMELMPRFNKAYAAAEQKYQRTPMENEISEFGEFPPNFVQDALLFRQENIFLDASLNDEEGSMHDIFPDYHSNAPIENDEDKEVMHQYIDEAFKVLNEKEKKVLSMYFGLNNRTPQTLDDIGGVLSITQERVRQIKENAIKKLKKLQISNRLWLFLKT